MDVEVEVVFLPGSGLSGDSGLGSVPLVQRSAAAKCDYGYSDDR